MAETRRPTPSQTYVLSTSSQPYGVVYRDAYGRRVIHVDPRVWTHGLRLPAASPRPTGKDRRHA